MNRFYGFNWVPFGRQNEISVEHKTEDSANQENFLRRQVTLFFMRTEQKINFI